MRPKKEKEFLANVAVDVRSGLLYRHAWVALVLEWVFLAIVYLLVLLPIWEHWTLLTRSFLQWLHAGLLVAWTMLRRYPTGAYMFLQSLHVAVLLLTLVDHLVLVVQLVQVGIGTAAAIGQMVALLFFCVFSLVRVGLLVTCC